MSKIAIKVADLSKAYQLGNIGTGTISRDIERWWAKMRGKEDPFLTIGETNVRTTKSESNIVWSLKDIYFEIEQGDAVGIIGRNGAGKSTLLKILSRVTAPTTGKILGNGRIASLLEVGTGFHPELTGRENIYLNGAILGMRKREIDRKFDEIVDFSGVERYIDTPVKRYSSGMYVRLAFAVAAHLESEILIVDEVLAVGDAEFQKKCLGKMGEVSKGEGRTVLFVSHNMGAIQSLCKNSIVLKNGIVDFYGSTSNAINNYLNEAFDKSKCLYTNTSPKEGSDILEVSILNNKNQASQQFRFDEIIKIQFVLKVHKEDLDAVLGFRIKDQLERNIFTSEVVVADYFSDSNIIKIEAQIPSNFLVPNSYQIIIGFHKVNVEIIRYLDDELSFSIEETGTDFFKYAGNDYGCVFADIQWNVTND